MTRIIEAVCEAGVVRTTGGFVVDPVNIITQGVQSSNGFLIIDGDSATYIATNTTDIVTFLEKASSALSTIASTLTAIGAGMLGSLTAPPPTLASSVTSINGVVSDLDTLKENLK